jgi:hypothetical protein
MLALLRPRSARYQTESTCRECVNQTPPSNLALLFFTNETDGGQGIWWACFNRTYVNGNCGPNDPPGPTPHDSGYYTWDQCLDFPVGG